MQRLHWLMVLTALAATASLGCGKSSPYACEWSGLEDELAPFATLATGARGCTASIEKDYYDFSLSAAEKDASCKSASQRGCSVQMFLDYQGTTTDATAARLQSVVTAAGYTPEPSLNHGPPVYRKGDLVIEYLVQTANTDTLVNMYIRNRPRKAPGS